MAAIKRKKNKNNFSFVLAILSIGFLIVYIMSSSFASTKMTTLNYSQFVNYLEEDKISSITVESQEKTYDVVGEFVSEQKITEESIFSTNSVEKPYKYYNVTLPMDATTTKTVSDLADNKNITIDYKNYVKPIPWLGIMVTIGIIFMLLSLFKTMQNQQNKMSGFMKKSKKVVSSSITFSDVAGYEEEKQELIEVVDFLKNPKIYTDMGAKIPKGILLVGPPGTGKTLLARAVAGEAGVNFLTQSGSEFVELYVGVGAARARELFKEAQKNSPCILFIDEIDAIGRRRGNGQGGGNDEKEQTLNQILIEMDGFLANSGVIVMAATNRVDVLDPALVRPGRFDRQILMNLPDTDERELILKVHIKNRKISKNISLKELAKNTSGFSGAELQSVINEAAIIAVRNRLEEIDRSCISEAVDRVIMGVSKKGKKRTDREKNIVSYHETGHAIIGLELNDASTVQKVTIVPRGMAGGYTSFTAKDDNFIMEKKALEENVIGLLGGRAAEELFCNTQTTGTHNDFERASKIVKSMITEYGMSDLGIRQFDLKEEKEDMFAKKGYSDKTAEIIDNKINEMLSEFYKIAKEILNKRKDDVHLMAKTLLEVDTLERDEIEYLIKNRTLESEMDTENVDK